MGAITITTFQSLQGLPEFSCQTSQVASKGEDLRMPTGLAIRGAAGEEVLVHDAKLRGPRSQGTQGGQEARARKGSAHHCHEDALFGASRWLVALVRPKRGPRLALFKARACEKLFALLPCWHRPPQPPAQLTTREAAGCRWRPPRPGRRQPMRSRPGSEALGAKQSKHSLAP